MPFDVAFDKVLLAEGGFTNDQSDRGGATRYGITERLARSQGYTGDMAVLPVDVARRIARAVFWEPLSLTPIDVRSPAIALELFDTGYNMGALTVARFLQRALNALNRNQHDYKDVLVDGEIGPATVAALEGYLNVRGVVGEAVLLKVLNSLQGARYVDIAEHFPQDEDFVFGWFAKRV